MQWSWAWQKPSRRRSPLTHHRASRTYKGLRNRLRRLTEPRERQDPEEEAGTPQEPGPDLPVSVQESPEEAWLGSALLRGWGHRVEHCLLGTFSRRSSLSSSPPPQFGLRSNNREGAQPCHSTENWFKCLLARPAPPEQDRFPHLSHQEASISLLSFSIRGQTERKPQSQKTNRSDFMDNNFAYSMKL